LDLTNKIIIHTSNSISTSNKLYDRRKLIAEELHKLKRARIHNEYVRILKFKQIIKSKDFLLDSYQSTII
jgi:hypothetical protein